MPISRKELLLGLGFAAWCLVVAQAFLPWWLEYTGQNGLLSDGFEATRDLFGGFKPAKLLASLGWLLAALAATTASGGYGEAVLRAFRLHTKNGWMRELLVEALGLGILGTAVLGLGLAGLLGGWLWLAVVPSAALRAFFWLRPVARAEEAPQGSLGLGFWALALPCLGLLVLVWISASAPVTDTDALVYHLALPKTYLAAGKIAYLPDWLHGSRSLLTEMLYLWGLGVGGEALARMMGMALSLLAVASVGLTAARFAGAKAGIASCLLFLSIPAVLKQASVMSTDVSVCLYSTLALCALLEWDEAGGSQRAWLWLSAVLAGFMLGCKFTGIMALAPLALFVAFLAWKREGPTRAVRTAALYAVVALAVIVPWFARSLWWTGNPVWPFAYSVFGGKHWNPMIAREATAFWSEPFRLADAGEAWQVFPRLMQGRFGRAVGFLLPLALPLGFRRRGRSAWVLSGFVVVTFVAWFLVSQQVRFLLPAFAAFSVLVGLGLADDLPRMATRALGALAAIAVLVTALWAWGSFSRDFRVAFGGQDPENYFARFPVVEASRTVNRLTPPDARVLMMWGSQSYYIDRKVLWGDPLDQGFFDYCAFRSAADFEVALKQAGATHVVIDGDEFELKRGMDGLLRQRLGLGPAEQTGFRCASQWQQELLAQGRWRLLGKTPRGECGVFEILW